MIGGNVTEKNVPRSSLQKIVEDLDGEINYQDLIDANGRPSKRIIITYREEEIC